MTEPIPAPPIEDGPTPLVMDGAPSQVKGRNVLASIYSDGKEWVCVLGDWDTLDQPFEIVVVNLRQRVTGFGVSHHCFVMGWLPALREAGSLAYSGA